MTSLKTLSLPMLIYQEITTRCNHNCNYCYNFFYDQRNEFKDPSIDNLELYWKNVTLKGEVPVIYLTGGEPLIRKDFNEILKLARTYFSCIVVNTNLTLFSDKYINTIKEIQPNILLVVAIPSILEEKYNFITNTKNYPKFIKSVSKLKQNSIQWVGNTVVINQNIDELVSIGDFIDKFGGYMFSMSRYRENFMRDDNLQLSPQDFQVIYEDALILQERYPNMRISLSGSFPLCAFDDYPKETPIEGCGMAAFHCVISVDGKIRPCIQSNIEIDDLNQRDFYDIWNVSLREFNNSMKIPIQCKKCKILPYCSFGCRIASSLNTNNLNEVDPIADPYNLDKINRIYNQIISCKSLKIQSNKLEINLDDTFKLAGDLIIRKEGGGILLYRPEIILKWGNNTTRIILKLIDENFKVKNIIEHFLINYDISSSSPNEIGNEVKSVISELLQNHLIFYRERNNNANFGRKKAI